MSHVVVRYSHWTVLSIALACLSANPVRGAFHLWRFTEIFSNEDGSVQFIELRAPFNNEHQLANHFLRSDANSFKVLTPLPNSSTANKHFIFGTAAFAALPGAVTPDYIIPDAFFNPEGDSLDWAGVDDFTFTDGQLPLDGFHSLLVNGTTAVNTPTNFAGVVGQINIQPPVPGDTNGDRVVDLVDLNNVRNNFGAAGEGVLGDTNNDRLVDLTDLNSVRNNFGVAASPVAEPTGMALGIISVIALAIALRTRGASPAH